MRLVLRDKELSGQETAELIASFTGALRHGDADFNALVCAQCKERLFVGRTSAKILPCGHAIHGTKECAATLDCPLCVSAS
jgi:hypothetical protein